jgi:hypothetical protein
LLTFYSISECFGFWGPEGQEESLSITPDVFAKLHGWMRIKQKWGAGRVQPALLLISWIIRNPTA